MMKHPDLTFEYNQITNNIFIGTNMCCQMHFDEELLQKGITADISLEKESVDAPFGVDFYTWIPVENHAAPKQEQLEFGVSVLDKLIKMNKKVYVHCQFGHGRAPTMVAAYLISQGKSVEDAIKTIKEKRSVIHLDDIQIQALKEFEKKIKDPRSQADEVST